VTCSVAVIGLLALVGWRGRCLYARWSRRQLQGICTGIAEYFQLPLWLVRLAFVWLFVAGLGGGMIYFLLAFLVDFHPDDRQHLMWFRIVRWWRRAARSPNEVTHWCYGSRSGP
jgi:phage shock protein PspC (stress-responsive transcriptional regulator)